MADGNAWSSLENLAIAAVAGVFGTSGLISGYWAWRSAKNTTKRDLRKDLDEASSESVQNIMALLKESRERDERCQKQVEVLKDRVDSLEGTIIRLKICYEAMSEDIIAAGRPLPRMPKITRPDGK